MSFVNIKRSALNRVMSYVNERRGWTTNRKIIVIESDDWGSIRMPNLEVYNKMLSLGYKVDQCNYSKFDTLASTDDFTHLFEVLSKYKDKRGNHPVITANTIVANPDFEKIKANGFKKYCYEPFTETLKRYSNRSFNSWEEGMRYKLFYPQLHGREHLNVSRWMSGLQEGSIAALQTFENDFFALPSKVDESRPRAIVASFDRAKGDDSQGYDQIINDASSLFTSIFGYTPLSFIAPNYFWDDLVEKALFENNIKYIQGAYAQFHPDKGLIYHYTGQVNRKLNDLIYFKRNVYFEPSFLDNRNWYSSALRQIENSFNIKKPAIICSHRVNFIGSILESNRLKNLDLFEKLLKQILITWPEVEFMTSSELGETIDQERRL